MQLLRRHSRGSTPSSPRLDASTIRRIRFRVVRQGFDPDETCMFLADVADAVEHLETRVRQLEEQLERART